MATPSLLAQIATAKFVDGIPLYRQEPQFARIGVPLGRATMAVQFSEDINDPSLADAAREQYLTNHPEAPLLAYVTSECNLWLQDLARRGVESESDKFVMMAAVNMVNCIAHAADQYRRALLSAYVDSANLASNATH